MKPHIQTALSFALMMISGQVFAQVYSVPVRWCIVADDANGNGRVDPGEQGAPAFANPGHVGEVDTDNVLWRRHERPSDGVFIPEAQVTFRSGVYNIVEDPTLRFPILPDPDPNPTGDPVWLYGDVLSAGGFSTSAEWNALHNACVDAWREQHGVEDIGIVVINANHYRSIGGDSEPGAAVVSGRRMILRDNSYVLPGSPLYGAFETPPDPTIVGDHVDKHFGHEAGHALAGLRHTCSNQNIMSNRRLDTSGDNLVDNIHLSASIAEVFDTSDCPNTDLPVVDQVQRIRDAAKAIPGCKIAGTNTDCTFRSDVRADRIRDAALPFADLSLVTITDEKTLARLVHEPMGPLERKHFLEGGYFDYYTFVDQDRDASTGGAAEALDVPVRFGGIELAVRVRVTMRDGQWLFAPTVWRFESGAFVEVVDRGIRAFAFPLHALSERQALHLSDQIVLEMPARIFGTASEFRVQAAVIQSEGKQSSLIDLLDDGREKPGRDYRWRMPTFPVCSSTPGHAERGDELVIAANGLLPNQPVHLIFGHRHIANGHADQEGFVKIPIAVPRDARDGQHLITVGTDGTALTADCIAVVKGGRRPVEWRRPLHKPGQRKAPKRPEIR